MRAPAFGREICGVPAAAERREWLVTNGTGSYASGTIAGLATRGYHGLLVAALQPPVGRTLLVAKLDETATYRSQRYQISANRWASGVVDPTGHLYLERFSFEGSIPLWSFALADAILEKRVWMEHGQDVTYVQYSLKRATKPLSFSFRALVNYRDYHGRTHANGWVMQVDRVPQGMRVAAYEGARPFFLLADRGEANVINQWCLGLELAAEKERGLDDIEDVLCAGSFQTILNTGESITFVASLSSTVDLNGTAARNRRAAYEQQLLASWKAVNAGPADDAPNWIQDLVLAADQFIVNRNVGQEHGKTVIAGYHWFTDWGRDTMISLPGLCLVTGRADVARQILNTFAQFVDQGMIPNHFPDDGSKPVDSEYNTVDASLWYFQAIARYIKTTKDLDFLGLLFPKLQQIIDAHEHGTRFNIHLDAVDGLLYAGQAGVQLTWMDAKVGDWVVTPRIGKPVEVNALWYNALTAMAGFARSLGKPARHYDALAASALKGFQRFWNGSKGYCFDVLDGPDGSDESLRPNQLLAISLDSPALARQWHRQVVDICGQTLLGSYGMRTLDPADPRYRGVYSGSQGQRDGAYHQGAAWAWLLGEYALAHYRAYGDPAEACRFLAPVEQHLADAGLGTVSEIFEGNEPFTPVGCIAQAWSVAAILHTWTLLQKATVP